MKKWIIIEHWTSKVLFTHIHYHCSQTIQIQMTECQLQLTTAPVKAHNSCCTQDLTNNKVKYVMEQEVKNRVQAREVNIEH